jgi:hypothetical protein
MRMCGQAQPVIGTALARSLRIPVSSLLRTFIQPSVECDCIPCHRRLPFDFVPGKHFPWTSDTIGRLAVAGAIVAATLAAFVIALHKRTQNDSTESDFKIATLPFHSVPVCLATPGSHNSPSSQFNYGRRCRH